MKKFSARYAFILGLLASVSISLASHSCSNDKPTDPGIEPQPTAPEVPVIKLEDRLPQISIFTNGGTIVDEPKTNAKMTVKMVDEVVFEGKIGIEIRGASSQMFPKKAYGLETRDASNEDLDVSLFNMPEESDWVLYAPYSDKSLMRNVLIYDLARELEDYASRTVFVDLSINGEYKGVYVFMEKLKRDSGRIDIDKLKDDENSGEELTGGYILKIDKVAGTNLGDGYNLLNSFTSNYPPPGATIGQEIRFLYEYPKAKDITAEQKSYISGYVDQFEATLASDDFNDPVRGYAPYIDVTSFLDFFLLNELSHNVDGYRLSTYLQKDKNGKLKMGPIWDFNLAFGNVDYCEGSNTNTWAYQFNSVCPEDYWLVPFWWGRLLEDPAYVSQLKTRWKTLRGGVLSEAAILAKIDNYTQTLEKAGAIDENFNTWPVLDTYIWPNEFVGKTYGEEVGYLKNWIKARLVWMDGAINGL
ncbi:CotH kinase family protein [Flavobacteriaceae bacterium F89]|uniref:CotH kinase family protein n=1 Tax=Cerina litoralis TaxID=2874477 RepID=A0AAE3JP72_9FLAO|nr:CotH kinase family protein [Cerina litoralis]MCG2461835.1 CotH kinase family protein [Cerina litoralis]